MYRNTAASFVIRSVFFRDTNVEIAFMTPGLLTLMRREVGNSNKFVTRENVFESYCDTDHKWTSYSWSELSLIEHSYIYQPISA